MKLVENIPLDTRAVANLIRNRDDLQLVWPLAKWPFDHDQWREVLDPNEGNRPFLVYEGAQVIGHAALRKTETPYVYAVSFLYLLPVMRSKGFGEKVIALLEEYAKSELSAEKLTLVVRTYNPGAIRCYTKAGFRKDTLEGTLIKMSKVIVDE